MALEAAVYQQDLFSHINGNKDNFYPLLLEPWFDNNNITNINYNNNETFFSYDCNNINDSCYLVENNSNNNDTNQVDFDWHSYYYSHHGVVNNDDVIIPPTSSVVSDLQPLNSYDHECWRLANSSSPDEEHEPKGVEGYDDGVAMEMVMRPKQRRRARAKKNQEEIENQRMTHIAVERNRRKQMNEYLNVLRSLMPESYVQRGDQASIVGAAINFVKELEYNVQNLSAKKQMKENLESNGNSSSSTMPFGEFFTFPQFSSNSNVDNEDQTEASDATRPQQLDHASVRGSGGSGGLAADVEVTMVESHAHLKIRLRRPPKQLSKLVSGLHSLRLSILHLNVNTADDGVVLYSFSLKVEDESKLNSVDEIAREVYQLLGRIQE